MILDKRATSCKPVKKEGKKEDVSRKQDEERMKENNDERTIMMCRGETTKVPAKEK